jgi:hypothetical protein
MAEYRLDLGGCAVVGVPAIAAFHLTSRAESDAITTALGQEF